EAAVPASVTIPAGQASVSFAVDAVDDWIVDGIQTVTITASAAGHAEAADTLDVSDDDAAGFVITQTGGGTTVSESGSTDTFAVVLSAQPLSNVVLTVVSGDSGEATVSPSTLTFTPANWNVAQSVTVTGVDDAIVDGDQTTTITVGVDAAASDSALAALVDQ